MMKEFKGTKGVWSVAGDIVLAEEETTISFVAGSIDDEHDANLIAAAPDLLDALDKITKEYIFTRGQLNGDTEDELADVLCIKNAHAAIAKALGETK